MNAGTDVGIQEHLTAVIDERDRRYEQRFVAQEQAVSLALARVDKEFHEHLQQVREETHAALESADKAIQKAEAATEKRFEGVNEFRGQLSDQTRTFVPRAEADARISAAIEKLDDATARGTLATKELENRHNDLELRLSNKLSTSTGDREGQDRFRELIGWVIAIGVTLYTFVTKN